MKIKRKVLKTGRKPHHYWQNFANVKRELEQIVEQVGYFPSQNELARLGYSGMADAISSYYGGIRRVSVKLGYEPKESIAKGDWKSLEFGINYASHLIKKQHVKSLPSQKELNDLGESSLCAAIHKYYGGFPEFRRLLGEKNIREKHGNWQDLNFVVSVARNVLRKHKLKRLPANAELRNLGYASLASSITKYHGGYSKFRDVLGEEPKRLPQGLWKDRKYVVQQLRKVMNEKDLKKSPTAHQLHQWGYDTICYAVNKYHGGFSEIRKDFGEKSRRYRESGSLKNLDYVLEQTKLFLESHPEFETLPGYWTAIRIDHPGIKSLYAAMQKYHGGINNVREKLNESLGKESSAQRLESFLEKYAGGQDDKR